MTRGLQATFDLLSKTKNEAAVTVLVPALQAAQKPIAEGALRALLHRNSPEGAREVIRRLHTMDDAWRSIVEQRQGRMSDVIREAILGPDHQTRSNAFKAVLWLREYDLVNALIHVAEDEGYAQRDLAASAILSLAELLYEELAQPRDYRNRRDPQLVRQHVISSLEESVGRYKKHRRPEILEAFLLLVNRDNVTLKQILMDPLHGSYQGLVELLSKSTRGGVIRLVLSFLEDPHAPSSAIALLASRYDPKFIEHLLKKIGAEPSPIAIQNLKRVDSIPWLQADADLLDRLNDSGQFAAVQMAVRSGMHRLAVFGIIHYMLSQGKVGGRRAAARALADFAGAEANALALHALNDCDPEVQAAALSQLRKRGIPGSLARLIDLVDSPHEVVRQAVRESLVEFSFKRFLSAYDLLEEDVRKSTGEMVMKIDRDVLSQLQDEMRSSTHGRRLRAISMAVSMGAVQAVETQIIAMLQDESHLVRAEAARALGQCNTTKARDALRQAMLDRSMTVQEIAEQSLQLLSSNEGQELTFKS